MRTVDLYYDYRSPFGFFLAAEANDFARRTNVIMRWKPVSIHALLNLQVGRPATAPYQDPLPPIKRAYLMSDVARGARFRGLTMRRPASLDSRKALQVSLSLEAAPADETAFREQTWRAMWSEGRDISATDELVACARHLGDTARQRVEAALDDSFHQLLIDRSLEAFASGVFGVPSFIFKDEVFFGSDRLDVLAWRLSQD